MSSISPSYKRIQKSMVLFGILLCCFSFSYATIDTDLQHKVDEKILNISKKLEKYTPLKQKKIVQFLKIELNKRITSNNRELLNYIILKLDFQVQTTGLNIDSHDSQILRFTSGGNHLDILHGKIDVLEKSSSVFIFRNHSSDLGNTEIQKITQELLSINPDILIFIDQEGGYVNRYVDFQSSQEVDILFKEKYVSSRMEELSSKEKEWARNIFPKNYGYFPSLGKIGVVYDNFSTETSKQLFLEIMSYIRLQSLKNNGINTYGLVADLNLGNPVISNSSRSFSKHGEKYKKLIDAFNRASNETGMLLYLKHFPGHGAGNIDSHKGILDLSNHSEYLKQNMELFRYFLDTSKNGGGMMVGHIVFDSSLKEEFSEIILKADFLLTDDLAMQGYKKMSGGLVSGKVFSTFEILDAESLIKVDTQYVENVY